MTRVVIGNWKMNPRTIAEAVGLVKQVIAASEVAGVEVAVAPAAIAVPAVALAARGSHVLVFAQDVHWEEMGAYTGQVSAAMLKGQAVGAIVGHSEVRRDLGDDDFRVAQKLARAVATGLRVVLCVGESEAQFLAGQTASVITRQIAAGTAPLTAARERASALVIAYEPVWAIGTGRPATAAHAAAAARAIRRALEAAALPPATPILYGGSVTAANAREFATAEGIDGALVGGASLEAQEFASIVQAFA